jgi:DNA-binding FrmR family transcriptional regulator
MDKIESAEKTCAACEPASPAQKRKGPKLQAAAHPDHSAAKARINRVKGQLDAVSRMIEERKYCPDILQQVRAATSALRGLEAVILRGHLRGCVKTAFQSKNAFDSDAKIEEIIQLWTR